MDDKLKSGLPHRTPQDTTAREKRTSYFLSLRTRLILMALLAVLPAMVLVMFNAYEQRKIGLETARQDALRVARMASFRHDQLIEDGRQLLKTLSELHDVRHRHATPCHIIFTNLLRFNPVYANIAAATPSGDIFASGIPMTNLVSIADREYFQEATNTMSFTMGNYVEGRITGKAIMVMAQPAVDQDGVLQAVVVVGLDLDWMYRLHASAQLPQGSSFTIFDRNFVTLARFPDPNQEYIGQRIGSPSRWPTNETQEMPPLEEGDRFGVFPGRDGVRRFYASTQLGTKMDENAVRVTVGIPVAVAFAASDRALKRDLWFISIATALVLATAWFGSDYFVLRRVRRLLSATQQLGKGDLSARTGVKSGGGELHELARRFDNMAASLEKQFAERQEAQNALKALNEELEKHVADRTRELRRSNEDLEQFAYVASHDLQEPLRMINSYLTLLRQRYKSQLDDDAQEFIGFAVDGGERMQRLIRDLLAYSRVQTKARPFEEVDVNELAARVQENLKIAIEESGAEIVVNGLPTVQGDSTQLLQLLQNLVNNAIKFRGDRPPRVRIDCTRQGDDWKFSVQDNGIGIPSDQFDRIFVIFQRLHGRDQYGGTGIGLAICKKIVERHGGEIWVESELGQSTTFFFTLPVHPQPRESSP